LNFKIRKYQTDDTKQILVLWEQTGLGNKERGDDSHVIENTIKLGGVFFVLENTDSSEIIGTSWITNDGRRLYLHHFGIKPAYQKKGLSKILLTHSLDFAKSLNMQIKLEVHETNEHAIHIYEKAGFKKLGDYMVYIIRNYNT